MKFAPPGLSRTAPRGKASARLQGVAPEPKAPWDSGFKKAESRKARAAQTRSCAAACYSPPPGVSRGVYVFVRDREEPEDVDGRIPRTAALRAFRGPTKGT